MWPLQQQWFFSISWGRAGTCRTTRPSPGPQSTRAHEAVRENADMERHPHGSLISAQLCLSVARRGHAPVIPPASRALRAARTHRVSSQCRREAPIEARRPPGTTGVPSAFYCEHLHRKFWQAFEVRRLPRKCSCLARPVPRGLPGTSAYRRSRREATSGRPLPFRSGTLRSGQTPRFAPGGRAQSNNEGQPNAAPSNPACSGLATLAADARG